MLGQVAAAHAGEPQDGETGDERQPEAREETQQTARGEGVEHRVVGPVVVEVGAPDALRELRGKVRRQHDRQRLGSVADDEARRRARLEEPDHRAPEQQALAGRAGEALGPLPGEPGAGDSGSDQQPGERRAGPARGAAGARKPGQGGEDDGRDGEAEQRTARRRPQRHRDGGERQPRRRQGGGALPRAPPGDRPSGGDRDQKDQRLREKERVALGGSRPSLPIDLPAQRIETGPLHQGVGDHRAGRGEPRGLASPPRFGRPQTRRQHAEESEQRELAREPEEPRRGSEEAAQRVDRGHRGDDRRAAQRERPARQGSGRKVAQGSRDSAGPRERRNRCEDESEERQDLQHQEAVGLGSELAVGILEEQRHRQGGTGQELDGAVEPGRPGERSHVEPRPDPGIAGSGGFAPGSDGAGAPDGAVGSDARGGKSAPIQNPPPQARCMVAKTAGSASAARRPRRAATAQETPRLAAR